MADLDPGYADYGALTEEAASGVPGCPPVTVYRSVQRAAVKACKDTDVWRLRHNTVALAENVYSYEYQAGLDARVARVLSGQVLIRPKDEPDNVLAEDLVPVRAEELFGGRVTGISRGWPAVANEGTPRYVASGELGSFIIAPTPDNTADYFAQLYVSLQPKAQSSSLPEDVLDELYEPILHRALMVLHGMAGQPWASQKQRDFHAEQYVLYTGRQQGASGEVSAVRTVEERPFV